MPTNITPTLKTIDVAPATFTPGKFQFQGADTSILERSMAQREARRNQAVQSKTTLDVSLGEVEKQLHSNEAGWFQKYKDNLQKDFTESVELGDYGNAFRTATMKAGEVAKDPSLIGRMESNKRFQEFDKSLQDKVDNGTISSETKEMLLSKNKYGYEDKYDSNGNIIKGDIWKATRQPVRDLQIANQAMVAFKLINPDKISHSWETTNTSNINESKEYQNITTGTDRGGGSLLEKVTEEEIRRNIDELINLTPDGLASVEQLYDTYMFQLDKLQKELDTLDPTSDEYRNKKQMLDQRKSLLITDTDGTPRTDYKDFYTRVIQQELFSKGLAYKVQATQDKKGDSSIYAKPTGSGIDIDGLGQVVPDENNIFGQGNNVQKAKGSNPVDSSKGAPQ